MSAGGLRREQIHLCLPSTCLGEQRSASCTRHWARIPGLSQETHTHTQRADRAQPSVTEDTDKALTLLSSQFSTEEVGPRLPGAPASLVPTPPAQAKPGEELSRGGAAWPFQCLPVSGPQGNRKANTGLAQWPASNPTSLCTQKQTRLKLTFKKYGTYDQKKRWFSHRTW